MCANFAIIVINLSRALNFSLEAQSERDAHLVSLLFIIMSSNSFYIYLFVCFYMFLFVCFVVDVCFGRCFGFCFLFCIHGKLFLTGIDIRFDNVIAFTDFSNCLPLIDTAIIGKVN